MKEKITTLKLNKEFKTMYYHAKFKPHPLVVSYVLKRKHKIKRFGITTSKKVGNAVKRNRARRVIKAAFFAVQSKLPAGYDYVFVARDNTHSAKSTQLEKIILSQINKLVEIKQ